MLKYEESRHKAILYSVLPKHSVMRCYIKRIASFNVALEMYLDDETFLMKAEAQNGSIGCNYYISASK